MARVTLFLHQCPLNEYRLLIGGLSPLAYSVISVSVLPIREISVERRGARVKRFFVSEAQRAELNNLTEYRGSVTPGDYPRGSFFGTFLR
jgi:hypothetical protein